MSDKPKHIIPHASFGPRHARQRVTYGGAQLLQQLERSRVVMARHHELMLEAGFRYDGMDCYTAPEGWTPEKSEALWQEACNAR